MKNHRFFVLLAVVMMASAYAFGGEVSKQRAKALGAKFVEANFKNVTDLEWAYTAVTESGRPSFHVFNGTAGGFIIISACDLTSPILGYAETGRFDAENIPDGLSYFLDGYGQSVDYAEERLQKPEFVIAQEWSNLERFGKTNTEKHGTVQPLVSTRWHQNCYYNASCPKDDDGPCERAYVGCVATAMGQVMKYWSYPAQGTGTHSYTCPPYGELYVDFSQAVYHWDEMPDALTAPHPALALLLYHCGVSVNMMYSAYASGAFLQDVSPALSTYFSYAPSQCLMREDYSHDEWVAMMREALDSEVPILYAGQNDEGGHAFVCDGYDANGLFHFNWCWGGQYDGYFSIDNLQVGIQNWNTYQKMVANARPLPVYNETPKAPNDFAVEPLSDVSYSGNVHWVNPNKTLSNSNLTHIDQIVVKRNGVVVYSHDNATPGASMQFTDEVPYYGLYDYQVYAVNNGIHGLIASQNHVVYGPSCTWTIEAGTTAPSGWQGAAIQVMNNASQVFESITATASTATLQIEVPLGRVSFVWVKGTSTVNDVSFTIKDAENQVVYSYSGPTVELPDGVFLQTNNSCGHVSDCGVPTDLIAEIHDEQTVHLAWSPASDAADYNVYRDGMLLRTVHGHLGGFVDDEPSQGGNCYYVTAFCDSGESDPTNEVCVNLGEGCRPPRNLWFEITSANKVKLLWDKPEPVDGLSGYYVYRKKEGGPEDWQEIRLAGSTSTSTVDNTAMEDETFYLYRLVAYYQDEDCHSAPAQSRYNPMEFFVRVYWSVDGVGETANTFTEVYPNPGKNSLTISVKTPGSTMQMFDVMGRKVFEKQWMDEVTTINTEAWPSGMYFWKMTTSSGTLVETGKWVKE